MRDTDTVLNRTSTIYYSLRPILLFANTNVSSTKMCLDIYISEEYYGSEGVVEICSNALAKKYTSSKRTDWTRVIHGQLAQVADID
jgi:hypothetical protein